LSVVRSTRLAAVVCAGVGATLLIAAPAGAATVGLGGGDTRLKLTKGAAAALDDLGVAVAPTGAARVRGGAIAFPVTGGRIDPATAAGRIAHSGGIRLRAGGTSVRLSDFTIRVGRTATISARVNGGARLAAFRLDLSRARVSRDDLTTVVGRVGVRLSPAAARALNRTFHVSAFRGGLRLGTARVVAEPSQIAFQGGRTDLALDAGVASALTALGVTPGVTAGATANADGSLGFPITAGRVNARTLAGTIDHSGGITLTAGATVVTLSDFRIDTRRAQLWGKVNGSGLVPLLALDLTAPSVVVEDRSVSVLNVRATLTQEAAAALNAAFGTTAFGAGLVIGTATVRGEAA
jgi:hypothetical protein